MPDKAYRRPEVDRRVIMGSILGILLAITLIVYGQGVFFALPDEHDQENKSRFVIPASPTLSPTPKATATQGTSSFAFLEPTASPTPVPGGRLLLLTPAPLDAGWVVSDDESIVTSYDPQNHFGDSFLYAGVLAEKVYHAAIRFDLRRIPRGTKVYAASLRLTGLRADQLSEGGRGVWQLQFLSSKIDYSWPTHNYEQIQGAASVSTFESPLTQEQLGDGQVNLFEFTPRQLALLERRIFEGNDEFGRYVSFRLDGPMEGEDNLFAWDSGYGPTSRGAGPQLFLSVGPPPEQDPAPYFVLITSTPTPENVVTAAANSLRMTAEAKQFGTATPLPPYWVTPMVVTATPTPENQATAQAMSEVATAIALTTGVPPNMVTATPTPENQATAQAMSELATAIALTTGVPPNMVTATPTPTYTIIPSTPTPTVRPATATPLPPKRVTPVVVTNTPTLANSPTPTPTLGVPTGAFTLVSPVTGGEPTYGPTDFEWRWIGAVPAGFGFEVRVWRAGEPPVGVHDAVQDNQNGNIKRVGENVYRLSIDIRESAGVRGRTGDYLWTVALVQISPEYVYSKEQPSPALLRLAAGDHAANVGDGNGVRRSGVGID